MALLQELQSECKTIFKTQWETRDGQVIPDPEDLRLGNDAVSFKRATVLYADLVASTQLVAGRSWGRAAEVYKAYLYCAAKLIRFEGGSITSYDGDRVMGIFIGDTQCTPAVRCAMKINYVVQKILNPAFTSQYPDDGLVVRHVIGIDTSAINAARTGVRGGNDIVWVGRAANYAAKLCDLRKDDMRTWITKAVYDSLNESAKLGGANREPMWKEYKWTANGDHPIHGSTWWWEVS
jgi:class 3 adenylate cyclase